MNEIFRDLAILYRDAARDMGESLRRGWIGIVAVYAYAVGLRIVDVLVHAVTPLMLAGLLVSITDALAVGALLALLQRAVSRQTLHITDVREVIGAHFWNVIAVGFVLWIPFMLIRQVAPPALFAMVSVLAAVFLNPLPEVIYQTRTGSPLEDLAESARFVHQQWIEWFLPIVLVAAPLGSLLFFAPEQTLTRGGLSFGRFLLLPTLLLVRVAQLLGLPPTVAVLAVEIGAPVITFALLLFRGHLFAILTGTSRRQRAFHQRSS